MYIHVYIYVHYLCIIIYLHVYIYIYISIIYINIYVRISAMETKFTRALLITHRVYFGGVIQIKAQLKALMPARCTRD